MAKIQELLANQHDKIDYEEVLKKYPWIRESDRYCILSPDSDGLLCGLFMAKCRGWKIVGFYDDKVGVVNKDYKSKDIVFLDGEIFRENAKSLGHHMVCLTNKKRDLLEKNFKNCIQPNLMRNYDGKKFFRLKYPLASIHLLVSIIAYDDRNTRPIKLTGDAIAPLFFTDGVFNVLFLYPENVLNWLSYLRINEDWNPLKDIFENRQYSVFDTIKYMDDFFRKRDQISVRVSFENPNGGRAKSIEERGDRLKISESDGSPYNILGINTENVYINTDAVARIKRFCTMVGEMTSWPFREEDWVCWDNLEFYKFSKGSFNADNKGLTKDNFEEFIRRKPLSWAQTSNLNIEYTLEEPSKFDFIPESEDSPEANGMLV